VVWATEAASISLSLASEHWSLVTALLVDITEEGLDMAWSAPITYDAVSGAWDLRDIGDLRDSQNISAVEAPRARKHSAYVPSPAYFPRMLGIINKIIVEVIIHKNS
jgi:hypothetical protein